MDGVPSHRTTVAATVALAAACWAGTVLGQQPTFPARIDAVAVDVVVVDKDGRPVEGLGRADFSVREDGVPQAVTTFESIAAAAPQTRVQRRLRTSTNAAAPERDDRWFFIAFDNVNISQFSTPRARDVTQQFLARVLQPGDRVMVSATSGGAVWTGALPEDLAPLQSFVGQLQGLRRPDTTAGRIWDNEAMGISLGRDRQAFAQVARRYFENNLIPESYPADREVQEALQVSPGLGLIQVKARQTYMEAQSRIRTALGSLERLSEAFAAARGRKTLLLVSEGFIMDPAVGQFRTLIQAARNANVAVHFVDVGSPEGVLGRPGLAGGAAELGAAVDDRDGTIAMAMAGREADGARAIAADTGGLVVTGTDLLTGLSRVAAEGRSYYLIGYSPSNQRRDGRFRKIQVSVARPGLVVRARNGYYAAVEREPAPAPPADKLPPGVRAALDSPFPARDLPMRISSYTFGANSGGDTQALFVADVDLTPLKLKPLVGSYSAKLDSYLLVYDRLGSDVRRDERLIEVNLPSEVYARALQEGLSIRREFQLPAGRYQATLVVRDRATGLIGSVRHELTVPPANQLRISTPILTDTLQRTGPGPGRPIPIARRTFAAGTRLVSAFDVYGPALSQKVSVGYVLRRADGVEVAAAPPQALAPGPNGGFSAIIGVQLPADAAGDHELVITVRDELTAASIEDREWVVVQRP